MQLSNLNTKILGRKLSYYKEIDSTQSEMWRRINDNTAENGMIIMADIQNNGIGTHGRNWYTSQNNNIAFTFLMIPKCNINRLSGITLEIASILVEIFDKDYGIKLSIKYPNDLVANNKKIGGILTETKIKGEMVSHLVVGIGINTDQTNFNSEIDKIASSIKNEFNLSVDRNRIISEFCNEFEKNIIEKIMQ